MPLVLTAIIVSIANLRQVTNAARLAVQTLVWFAITALIAVTIGITIGLLTNPGANATIGTAGAAGAEHTGSWLDFLPSIVPANILGLESSDRAARSSFNVLQLVVLGIVLGAAALAVGPKAEPFLGVVRSVPDDLPEDRLVDHPARPDRHRRPDRRARSPSYGWDLVAPLAVFTIDVYVGCADRAVRRLPAAGPRPRAEARATSSPAPGRRSSSPSCPAARSAPCR